MVLLLAATALAQEGQKRVATIVHDYPYDPNDACSLVGASFNVFVATVKKKVGNIDDGVHPHTRFEVQVVTNIKGHITGSVFLDQFGGTKNGRLVKSAPGDEVPPLEVGATYVFATRSRVENPEKIFRLHSHRAGTTLITKEATLSNDQLKKIAEAHDRVIELKNAYKDQTVLPADAKDPRNQRPPVS